MVMTLPDGRSNKPINLKNNKGLILCRNIII